MNDKDKARLLAILGELHQQLDDHSDAETVEGHNIGNWEMNAMPDVEEAIRIVDRQGEGAKC